ncbi:MAG: hypothetical protein WCJ71_05410 [Candidatus Omnitrophota bacterium]
MKKLNLNQIHSLAKYPMTRANSLVMAQAWFLSTKGRHAVCGRGLLRDAREDLA